MTKKGRTEERMVDSEMSGGTVYNRYALICVCSDMCNSARTQTKAHASTLASGVAF